MTTDRRVLIPFLAFVCATAGSCVSGQDDASLWRGRIRDSAGVAIVRNPDIPLWTADTRWTFREVLKIGVTEGDSNYMFGQIKGIAALADGRVVVYDGLARHLRFFHPDGRYERTVGRRGPGPGEFAGGRVGIIVGPGDTLLVLDDGNQRANRISWDGNWIDSWQYQQGDAGWLFRAFHGNADGVLLTHMSRTPGTGTPSDTFDVVVSRDAEGTVVDTLAWIPASRVRQLTDHGLEFYLYAGEPVVALCEERLVAGRGDRYRLSEYDLEGNLRRIVLQDRPNLELTAADRTFIAEHFEMQLRESGMSADRIAEMNSALRFTATYPAFGQLLCGPRGSLWVWRTRPLSTLTEEEAKEFWVGPYAEMAPEFDVFDRERRFLGVMTLPPGFWPEGFFGDRLYGRWRDSLDVEHVMALAIEGLPQT